MTNKETRRYEMLLRVREFGRAHRDLFPESTRGGEAFAAVDQAVRQLTDHAVAKLSTAEEGKAARTAARTTLAEQLTAIAQTARVVASKAPGFNDVFRLPKWKGDSAMMTAGRMFVREAERLNEEFVAYGLPASFLADAAAAVDGLEQAVRGQAAGKTSQNAARMGIAAAIASGLEAARTLDVIVANRFRRDPLTRAAWTLGRRIPPARRARGAAPAPSPSDAAPAAGSITASPSASGAAPAADTVKSGAPNTPLRIAS